MVPSSVTNRKIAGAEVGCGEPVAGLVKPLTLKPPPAMSVLNTVPVGVPLAPSGSPGAGMLTTSELIETGVLFVPGTLYRVDRLVPLSEIQNGPAGLSEMPQGLTRWGSVTAATPGRSD